jgi:hypothetical protein
MPRFLDPIYKPERFGFKARGLRDSGIDYLFFEFIRKVSK